MWGLEGPPIPPPAAPGHPEPHNSRRVRRPEAPGQTGVDRGGGAGYRRALDRGRDPRNDKERSMAVMTGGEAIVKTLAREGVRVVFGLPGVQLYGIIAALRDEPDIKFITCRHEGATSFMADGYARAG